MKGMDWPEDTPWRQGHILPRAAVENLGFIHSNGIESSCVMVISHDCDLNRPVEIEPDVEVIVGTIPEKTEGNFTWAKSPRTLHLPVVHDGKHIIIELVATQKKCIHKSKLTKYFPDSAWSLVPRELSALRAWLAVRYKRSAFSNAFESALDHGNCKFKGRFAKLIFPTHNLLSKIFFDVDGGEDADHSDGSAYLLKIVLLYPPGEDPEKSADQVDDLAQKIIELFEKFFFHKETETWSGIHLGDCFSVSEDDMTISMARKLSEWRLEHMSLKEDEGTNTAI